MQEITPGSAGHGAPCGRARRSDGGSKRLPGRRKIERSWRGVNQRFRIFVRGRFRGGDLRWAATSIDCLEMTGWDAPLHKFENSLDYIGFGLDFGWGSLLKSFRKMRSWELTVIFEYPAAICS